MKDKKTYIILGISILFMAIGISYAYFSLNVIGNDTAKNNRIVTGNLELTFTDTSEIVLDNMLPGDSVTKTIKVSNTGTKEVAYNVGWTDYENGIINNELIIEGTCKRLNSSNTEEGTCNNVSKKAITGSNVISNIQIEPNVTHEYTLTITFKETNKPQNYNKNKSFNGKLNITESTAKTVYCTFDGELTQGAEYVNGQYTYRYKQEGKYASSGLAWQNITSDGWGVQLTDKTSTEPVTSKLCTYINNKPVVSMSYMFYKSQATSIDLSSFNTSNVTNMENMFDSSQATTLAPSNFNTSNVVNMSGMFEGSQATTLDLSNFNTSNVVNMSGMFSDSKATTLDPSNFNTSNVVNMSGMFSYSKATTLDLSNFDTSNVTDMSGMFEGSQATTLDLSNFDTSKVLDMSFMFSESKVSTIKGLNNINTSNVTNMESMFYDSNATTLNLSSFDTSNVVNMNSMFYNSKATTLDVSKFDTSNVTDMGSMFYGSNAITLNLSNFNTSNVTDMSGMFSYSKATTLDLSNFDTSKVTHMEGMFANSKATTLDLSNFNTSNVTNMESMFDGSQATTLDLSNFDTSNVINMSRMFNSSTNLKTIYSSDKFNTNNVRYSVTNMFTGCTSLVGGAGTKYNSSYVDKTYARIDGGTSNPGYFTLKN